MAPTTAVLAGSTGLVGSHILPLLLTSPTISKTHAYTRRTLPTNLPNTQSLSPISSSDTSTWPSLFPQDSQIFISALGTTRAAAGSFAKQKLIDHDLNVSLAQAAKKAGVKTYVLISSNGADPSSRLGYAAMKGETEEAVKQMGFKDVVIVRPGLIVGDRQERRTAEWVLRKAAQSLGSLSAGLKDFWAQDADVIAKAAVSAGLRCVEGKGEGRNGVWVLEQADVIRLGRTEWKQT